MSMLTRAAVYAADGVLCPTICEYLSVAGVRQLVALMAEMRGRYQRRVRLVGIQPNKYLRSTTEHRQNLVDLVRAYGAWGQGGLVWPPLRQSIDVARAGAEGRPVWEGMRGKVLEEWEGMVGRVGSLELEEGKRGKGEKGKEGKGGKGEEENG
jgi:chromosome partitioning protein